MITPFHTHLIICSRLVISSKNKYTVLYLFLVLHVDCSTIILAVDINIKLTDKQSVYRNNVYLRSAKFKTKLVFFQ